MKRLFLIIVVAPKLRKLFNLQASTKDQLYNKKEKQLWIEMAISKKKCSGLQLKSQKITERLPEYLRSQ